MFILQKFFASKLFRTLHFVQKKQVKKIVVIYIIFVLCFEVDNNIIDTLMYPSQPVVPTAQDLYPENELPYILQRIM